MHMLDNAGFQYTLPKDCLLFFELGKTLPQGFGKLVGRACSCGSRGQSDKGNLGIRRCEILQRASEGGELGLQYLGTPV